MEGLEFLSQEYFEIMKVISNYDNILMIIKGWSITIGIALIGYSLKYNKRSILLVCAFCALCFAFVDAKFKEYQTNYYGRMQTIENCIHDKQKIDDVNECKPLFVHQSWEREDEKSSIIDEAHLSNIYIPHFFIIIISILLFIFWKPVTVIND